MALGGAAHYRERVRALAWTLIALALLPACKEEMRAPAAPPGDIDSGVVRPPPGGGGDDDDDDAGMRDGGGDAAITRTCIDVTDDSNAIQVRRGASVIAFGLERAFLDWDCRDDKLLIGMTDGACIAGSDGSEFLITIDRSAIGTAVSSSNTFNLQPAPMDDLVSASIDLETLGPSGLFERSSYGSCTGSSGSFVFEDIDDVTAARVAGTFDLVLSDCEDETGSTTLILTGSFDMDLAIDSRTACMR